MSEIIELELWYIGNDWLTNFNFDGHVFLSFLQNLHKTFTKIWQTQNFCKNMTFDGPSMSELFSGVKHIFFALQNLHIEVHNTFTRRMAFEVPPKIPVILSYT